MKFSAVLLAAVANAAPHYTFPHIQGTADWQSVRITANHYSNGPVTDVTSDAIRCYQLTPGGGGSTATSAVRAGGSITWSANPNIYHPGALSAYMAKVPEGQTLAGWDGAGAVWFKVYQDMPTVSGGQMAWPSQSKFTSMRSKKTEVTPVLVVTNNLDKASVSFTVPSCIESGDYLFRIEHVALHSASKVGGAQFYISCAQISVTGGSGAKKPSDLVAFPGAYKATDPGIMLNIYNNAGKAYTPAGPAVFTC